MSEKTVKMKIDELISNKGFEEIVKKCSSKKRYSDEDKIQNLYNSAQDFQAQLIQLKKDLWNEYNACSDTDEKDGMSSTARKMDNGLKLLGTTINYLDKEHGDIVGEYDEWNNFFKGETEKDDKKSKKSGKKDISFDENNQNKNKSESNKNEDVAEDSSKELESSDQ